jgi:predicted phage terminase large subunit-like protein
MGRFAKNIPVYGVKDFKLKKYQHTVFDQPYLPDPIINIEKAGKLLCRCLVVAKGDSFLVNDIVVHNSSGKESAEGTIRNLAGYVCRAQTATGDKATRADPFSVQVNNGGVMLLNGGWVHLFVEELRFFPYSTYKDQTDAASLAFSKLVAKKMARVIR